MAYSANQTKLFYKSGAVTAYAEIPLLMEVPEFGGAPEKIDVTTLSDTSKRYIPGIKDFGDLVFKFLYEKTRNYDLLAGLANAYKEGDDATIPTFKLEYPDDTTHEFRAIPSVKMDAGAINGALTFTATMSFYEPVV